MTGLAFGLPDSGYSRDGMGAERWRFYIVGGSQVLDVFRRPRAYLEPDALPFMLRRTTRAGDHIATDYARDRRQAERLATRLTGVDLRTREARKHARRMIRDGRDPHGLYSQQLEQLRGHRLRFERPKESGQ